MNHHAVYLRRRSFSSKVIVWTDIHTLTNTHETDCATWTTNAVDSSLSELIKRWRGSARALIDVTMDDS